MFFILVMREKYNEKLYSVGNKSCYQEKTLSYSSYSPPISIHFSSLQTHSSNTLLMLLLELIGGSFVLL